MKRVPNSKGAADPLKLNVLIVHFPYAGNGGFQSEIPALRRWETETVLKAKADDRVGFIRSEDIADTPITMTRNRAVLKARACGAHVLLMVDSDQDPFRHAGESWHKPFWDVAFDTLHQHYQRGPLVIGAPYVGPPPHENCYVFQFEPTMSGVGDDEVIIRLEQFTRSQAATMTGVGEVAALPTGMIMYDMRIFDLVEPCGRPRREVLQDLAGGAITVDEAERQLTEGWFFYEWKDGYAAEKASTEDVAATRDMGLACQAKFGYNPIRCAWDSWIGHYKPWNCGRPQMYKLENVAKTFRNVVERGTRYGEQDTSFESDVLELYQESAVEPQRRGRKGARKRKS